MAIIFLLKWFWQIGHFLGRDSPLDVALRVFLIRMVILIVCSASANSHNVTADLTVSIDPVKLGLIVRPFK